MSWRLLTPSVLGLPCEILRNQNDHQTFKTDGAHEHMANSWEGHCVQTFAGRKNEPEEHCFLPYKTCPGEFKYAQFPYKEKGGQLGDRFFVRKI